MRRPFLSGAVMVVAAGLVFANGRLFSPRNAAASRAAVLAALPASLKVQDTPDPAGVARFARLAAIAHEFSGRAQTVGAGLTEDATPYELLDAEARRERAAWMLDALLAEGPIRYPAHAPDWNYRESTDLKGLAKVLAFGVRGAAQRGDQAACARLVGINLRLGQALVAGKGVAVEELVGVAIEAIAERSAYEAEMLGGLDASGRAATLALLPPLEGPMPEIGDAVRRSFQTETLPVLLDPARRAQYLSADGRPPEGTFDALATARLVGRIDEAAIADSQRSFTEQTHEGERLAAQAGENLPSGSFQNDQPGGLGRAWTHLYYRFVMDSGPNTLGRTLASTGTFEYAGSIGPRRAASRNLVRAVILLRSGAAVRLSDPYDGALLRVDPKRKVVWSVGTNKRDDGGRIGQNGVVDSSDQGYAYGPGAWKPLPGRSVPGGPPPSAVPGD